MADMWQLFNQMSSLIGNKREDNCNPCCINDVTPQQESSGFMLMSAIYLGSAALLICGNQLMNRYARQRNNEEDEPQQQQQQQEQQQQQAQQQLQAPAELPAAPPVKQWPLGLNLCFGNKWQRVSEQRRQYRGRQRGLRKQSKKSAYVYKDLDDDEQQQLQEIWQDVLALEDTASIIDGEAYFELSDDEDKAEAETEDVDNLNLNGNGNITTAPVPQIAAH